MRSTSWLPLVLVGFLAALTFWLERVAQFGGEPSHAKERHDPDFYVEQFRVRRYDDDGSLLNTLVAEKMLHFPDDDTTKVIGPRLTYEHRPQTEVTAKTAWLDKDGKHVRLDDDVRIVRAGENAAPDTVITTSVLYVTPDNEYARTDAPVTITQGQTVIRGGGATVDNKGRVSVLSGRVNGTIYRNQKK